MQKLDSPFAEFLKLNYGQIEIQYIIFFKNKLLIK